MIKYETDFERINMKVLISVDGITFLVLLITSPCPLTKNSTKYGSENSMSDQDNISTLMNATILLICPLWQSIGIVTSILKLITLGGEG